MLMERCYQRQAGSPPKSTRVALPCWSFTGQDRELRSLSCEYFQVNWPCTLRFPSAELTETDDGATTLAHPHRETYLANGPDATVLWTAKFKLSGEPTYDQKVAC